MEDLLKENISGCVNYNTTSCLFVGTPTEGERIKVNTPLVEIIRNALYGKKVYPKPKDTYSPSYEYLLNQSLRQYIVPVDNIHVTAATNDLWYRMFATPNSYVPDIRVYAYQDTVVAQSDVSDIETYKGNSKRPIVENISKGEKVKFNSIFIQEHTTPVADMIVALELLQYRENKQLLDAQEIILVLDKMHITQMLKSEDKGIRNARHRIDAADILDCTSEDIFSKIVNNTKGYPTNFAKSDLYC